MTDDFMKKILARMEELQMTNVKPSPNAIILATGSGFKSPGEVDYNSNTRRICECGSEPQWGSLSERSVHASVGGVKVFSSPHLPPDTMLVIDDTPIPPMPMLTMPFNPHEFRRPKWEPNFDALLAATHRTLLTNNRGRFNTIIVADESPIIPERPRVCWTCGQTFMSRRMVGAVRQCDYCTAKFDRKRAELHDDLRCLADQVFMQTLIQKGYTSWTLPRPRPPFKSASQTRAAAQKAKAKARRKALRSRRRSKKALQRA